MSKNHKDTQSPYVKKIPNKRPKFKKGNPGKPKGAKNRISRTVRENIEETFQKLGGVEGLVKWANKSNSNREKVYSWYFSMLPKNVDANVAGDLTLTIKRIITDKRPD